MHARKQLVDAVEAFRAGNLSLDQFEDSFRGIAQLLFAQSHDVRQAIIVIENLLAELRAGYIQTPEFLGELVTAIHPFAGREKAIRWKFFVQPLSAEPRDIQPNDDFRQWNVVLLHADENRSNPGWGTQGTSNSTEPIPPQRETVSASGITPART